MLSLVSAASDDVADVSVHIAAVPPPQPDAVLHGLHLPCF